MPALPRSKRHRKVRHSPDADNGPLGDLGLDDLKVELSWKGVLHLLKNRPGDCITLLMCIPILAYIIPPTRGLGLAVIYPGHNTTDADTAGMTVVSQAQQE